MKIGKIKVPTWCTFELLWFGGIPELHKQGLRDCMIVGRKRKLCAILNMDSFHQNQSLLIQKNPLRHVCAIPRILWCPRNHLNFPGHKSVHTFMWRYSVQKEKFWTNFRWFHEKPLPIIVGPGSIPAFTQTFPWVDCMRIKKWTVDSFLHLFSSSKQTLWTGMFGCEKRAHVWTGHGSKKNPNTLQRIEKRAQLFQSAFQISDSKWTIAWHPEHKIAFWARPRWEILPYNRSRGKFEESAAPSRRNQSGR